MNIDLFITKSGQTGLIATKAFDEVPAGVLFDAETLLLTIEFIKEDPFHCNIPIDVSLREKLLFANAFYIGLMEEKIITEALRLPLMLLNDPYKDSNTQLSALEKPMRSLKDFDQFLKNSAFAQALHRDDLSDEGDSQSILKGARTKELQYAAKLQRQPVMEITPQGPQVPQILPEAAPQVQGPAPKGPGGASMGSSTARRTIQRKIPPKSDESD